MIISFLGLRLSVIKWPWKESRDVSIGPAYWTSPYDAKKKKRLWWGICVMLPRRRLWTIWDWNWFKRDSKHQQEEVEE